MKKLFDTHLLLTADQLALVMVDYGSNLITATEHIYADNEAATIRSTRVATGPRVGGETKLQCTDEKHLNGKTWPKSTLVAWAEAKRYVSPFTRAALNKNVARALVKAGYKKTSTSAAVSDLLRRGAIAAVEA